MTPAETHPFYRYVNAHNKSIKGGFIPSSAQVLITGTFPPKKEYTLKGDGFFFFSSHKNHLFNRFDNIFQSLSDYKKLKKTNSLNENESYLSNRKRKEIFAEQKGIAFVDVFTKIQRCYEGSVKDQDLIPIENIVESGLLKQILLNNNILRICCVYDLAYQVLKAHLGKIAKQVNVVSDPLTANREKLIVNVEDKIFEVVLLYPATRSGHKSELKDEQYKRYIFDRNKESVQ